MVKQMKQLRNLLIGVLVFAILASFLQFAPYSTYAVGEIGIKPSSDLRIKEWGDREILVGLPEKSTVDQLLSMVNDNSGIRAQKDGVVLSGDEIVTTGTELVCGSDRLAVVIKGDASGDGAVNLTDALRIKAYFLKDFPLSDLLLAAADVSEDGVVNSTDYLQIKNYLLKKWNIYTNQKISDGALELVTGGQSEYSIVYERDSVRAAAHTLREQLSLKLGVDLPVKAYTGASAGDKVILIRDSGVEDLGNCGYAIEADGTAVILYAAALSGFDKAITRLLSGCTAQNTLTVPADYFVLEEANWETDYVLQGDDYNPNYNADVFYNDKNDSVAYVTNAMWHMFGAIDDGQKLVYTFGNEPTYYEWVSEKVIWSTEQEYVNKLKTKIASFPQTSTGYMWSWSTFPYWKVDNCYSIHYDGTFRYIASVYDIISWEGNTSFLYTKDTDTASGDYASVDASRNRTVLDKTVACMDYILDYLYGREGYIRLTEESTYLNASGTQRFDYVVDAGIYCWDNTGKNGSHASNYWDNLCFGNYDAYSNALFYNALHSMAGIYRMMGTDYEDEALELEALAVKVKDIFNKLYWSEATGRYLACIDTDGRAVDYGFTFLNFEILKYGLADEEKAQSILSWVDGERIIPGEDRTGSDIFSYAKAMELVPGNQAIEIAQRGLRLAAATNTVAINRPENQSTGDAWWHGPSGINVWSSASYGKHLENGGYIFYPVFYELMARTEYEGAQSTTERLYEIGEVYEYNRLKSDATAANAGQWLEGLNGEFPENGLVPTAYLYSLMGTSAEYDGLHIAPSFNEVYEYMGVKELTYGGNVYAIQVNRDASCTITPANGVAKMNLHYTPERFQDVDYTVTVEKANGTSSTTLAHPDENGVIYTQIDATNVSNVTITPVLN